MLWSLLGYNLLSIPFNLLVTVDIIIELQSWLKSTGVSSIFIMKPDKLTLSISLENYSVLLKGAGRAWLQEQQGRASFAMCPDLPRDSFEDDFGRHLTLPQYAFQNSSDTICLSLSTEEVEWKLYPKYGFFLPGAWKMSHFSQPTKSVYLYWKPLGQNQIFINWKKLNEKKRVTNKTIPGYARFLLLLSQ